MFCVALSSFASLRFLVGRLNGRSDSTDVIPKNMNHKNNIPDESKPPMQNDMGVFPASIYGRSPFYRFVTISVLDDGIELLESLPFPESAEFDGETCVENVIETYSVQVPNTTHADGKSVTRFTTQHRKRTVQIKKRVPMEGSEERFIEHSYTVCVPYSEMIDGVPIARSRLETRTRLVSENEIPRSLVPLQQTKSIAFENLSFYNVDGQKLDANDVLNSLEQYIPVIHIADPNHVVPYFSKILKPETVFLVLNG